MRFSFGMNVYRALEFSIYHSSPVARVKFLLGRSGLGRIPNESAKPTGKIVTVAITRPGCDITRLWIAVPNECLPVFGGLIISVAGGEFSQPQQCATNQKQSSSHLKSSDYGREA